MFTCISLVKYVASLVHYLSVKKDALPKPDVVIPTVNYAKIGEVIDEFYNVAKGKNTSASSEPWGGKASRAVDGGVNQNWNK